MEEYQQRAIKAKIDLIDNLSMEYHEETQGEVYGIAKGSYVDPYG